MKQICKYPPYTTNLEHLHAELYRLDVLIEKEVRQFRASRQQNNLVEFQGLYISDDEIDRSMSEGNETYRLQIWQRMFPPQAPLSDDIDFEFLATKFKIAGGNIKNVALTAAFRAAKEDSPIQMKHLILSMKREYQKLGKICERTEFEPYYELVR